MGFWNYPQALSRQHGDNSLTSNLRAIRKLHDLPQAAQQAAKDKRRDSQASYRERNRDVLRLKQQAYRYVNFHSPGAIINVTTTTYSQTYGSACVAYDRAWILGKTNLLE